MSTNKKTKPHRVEYRKIDTRIDLIIGILFISVVNGEEGTGINFPTTARGQLSEEKGKSLRTNVKLFSTLHVNF